MKNYIALGLAIVSSIPIAYGQHAHSHGVGEIGIVVEGEQLTVLLEIPQHDVVGFERAPKNAREQLTVQAALEKLGQPERLLVPSAAGQCALVDKVVEAPVLTGGKAAEGHTDVAARYVFRCAQPAALKTLQVNVMAEFVRVRSLTVSFAGPQGQKAGKLDGKNPVFAW